MYTIFDSKDECFSLKVKFILFATNITYRKCHADNDYTKKPLHSANSEFATINFPLFERAFILVPDYRNSTHEAEACVGMTATTHKI